MGGKSSKPLTPKEIKQHNEDCLNGNHFDPNCILLPEGDNGNIRQNSNSPIRKERICFQSFTGNDVCFGETPAVMLALILFSLLAIFITINFYRKKTYKTLTTRDPELGSNQQNEISDSPNNWHNFTLENNTQSTTKKTAI